MPKFAIRFIEKRIENAIKDKVGFEIHKRWYPVGTLGYARANLAIAVCNMKVEFWKAFLDEN